MKSLLFSVLLVSTALPAQLAAEAPHRNEESQNRLVGAWKLVSLKKRAQTGKFTKRTATACSSSRVTERHPCRSCTETRRLAVPMRRVATKLPTAATTSTTLPLSRFTSMARSYEHSSAKT